jgi:hypothetical protein
MATFNTLSTALVLGLAPCALASHKSHHLTDGHIAGIVIGSA